MISSILCSCDASAGKGHLCVIILCLHGLLQDVSTEKRIFHSSTMHIMTWLLCSLFILLLMYW